MTLAQAADRTIALRLVRYCAVNSLASDRLTSVPATEWRH